ncbi:MAG: bifunctional phosphoribosyl-AMP cyclohydrolase/phosphoribosyl-ATP pyrophosphatase [Chloroflexi bacterium]|nr:bifunctional phosphoribosyl-AMP cyclohydrolase/phosphoribosyl-ATP pyrophosphatase [Chloroflexota bacterium]
MVDLKFDDKGLIPVIIQNAINNEVIMLGYMNKKSIEKTLQDRQIWFYSRSRSELWHKGATSGNYMNLVSIIADCDGDALFAKVNPAGPSCHTGKDICFETPIQLPINASNKSNPINGVNELEALIKQRKIDMPSDSYTADMLRKNIGRTAQKIVEEAGELAIASVQNNKDETISEASDLMYHLLLLLIKSDIEPSLVWEHLRPKES